MAFGKLKPLLVTGAVAFAAYMVGAPILSQTMGSVTGQYTASAVAAVCAVIGFWVSNKFSSKIPG